MHMKSLTFNMLALLAALILVSCGTTTPATPESSATYPGLAYSVAQESRQVQFAGGPFEIQVDNCDSARDSIKREERSKKFLTEFNIEISNKVAVEFGGNIGVAKASLRDEIGIALGVRLGTELETKSAVEIVTPAGKRTVTTLQWKEVWTEGSISVKRPDGSFVDVLPFAALNSLTLEQLSSQTLDCTTGKVVIQEATPQISTPEIPVIPPTPAPVSLGTISVPGNSNEGMLFTASRSGQYIFKYVNGAYSTYPLNRIPEGLATWLADVRVFKNRSVEWIGNDISEHPEYRIINLGYSFSADEAEAQAKEYSVPVSISLAQGDTLILVAIDKKDAYNDNPGEVVLEVLFVPAQ